MIQQLQILYLVKPSYFFWIFWTSNARCTATINSFKHSSRVCSNL